MKIEGNQKELDAMAEFHKECVAIHRAHQEHVPNCMRPLLNKKLKLLSELTEHTLANEIEAPHEILRKPSKS